ncbi:cell cycle checkpoint control protein rad9a [Irineochytrium annulatum]|nr:cell cycle checkpoint control protein rad9a [Irineochytrium annulatum]
MTVASLPCFAKFTQALQKVGEELSVEFQPNEILPGFFDSYSGPPDIPDQQHNAQSIKLLLKTINNIFKQKTNQENVETCKIQLQSGDAGDRLVVQLLCKFGVKKTHKLHYESCDATRAVYSKSSGPNLFAINPKVAHDWIACFAQKLEEVTISCTKDTLKLRSFTEDTVGVDSLKRGLQTEITVDPEEFDVFEINQPTEITFNLKDLKTALSFADVMSQPLTAYFSTPGKPLVLEVAQPDQYCADFVIATVAEVAFSQESEMESGNVPTMHAAAPKQSASGATAKAPDPPVKPLETLPSVNVTPAHSDAQARVDTIPTQGHHSYPHAGSLSNTRIATMMDAEESMSATNKRPRLRSESDRPRDSLQSFGANSFQHGRSDADGSRSARYRSFAMANGDSGMAQDDMSFANASPDDSGEEVIPPSPPAPGRAGTRSVLLREVTAYADNVPASFLDASGGTEQRREMQYGATASTQLHTLPNDNAFPFRSPAIPDSVQSLNSMVLCMRYLLAYL